MLELYLWIAESLKRQSTQAFFANCYHMTHQKPCGSNRVYLDARKYEASAEVPDYVESTFERGRCTKH